MDPLDYLHLSRVPLRAQPPKLERLNISGQYATSLMVHAPLRKHGLPVLMLHGIQSHPGWFVGSADALAGAGHPVYQLQRRGSGANAKDRGHASSPQELLSDLDVAIHHVLTRTGAPRLHLVGISWGGKYAACYAMDRRRAGHLCGLTLVTPGIVPQVDVSVGTKLAIGLSCLLAPRKYFPIPLNDTSLFTDNPAMRDYLGMDVHRLQTATASFLLTSYKMDKMLAAAPEGALSLPVTLFLARRDRIIDNAATRRRVQELAGPTLRVIEMDAAHTIEFEPDPEPYFAALVEAVAAHE